MERETPENTMGPIGATIFDPRERQKLHDRIRALTPQSQRCWGKMTVQQMVCHLTDAIESSGWTTHEERATGALTKQPLKWLVINALPWPKGKLQSPPELLERQPTTWEADITALREALERVGRRGPSGAWPASDVFGELSGKDWGALLRTHVNHHLKQFGV